MKKLTESVKGNTRNRAGEQSRIPRNEAERRPETLQAFSARRWGEIERKGATLGLTPEEFVQAAIRSALEAKTLTAADIPTAAASGAQTQRNSHRQLAVELTGCVAQLDIAAMEATALLHCYDNEAHVLLRNLRYEDRYLGRVLAGMSNSSGELVDRLEDLVEKLGKLLDQAMPALDAESAAMLVKFGK